MRLIRLPNNSFWRDYDSDGGRNLKTQKGFIQCVPLETINTRFPPEEWFHIYTDGSLLTLPKALALVFLVTSSPFYLHAGPLTTHTLMRAPGKDKGKIVFQWVPSHCGLWGNERQTFCKKGNGYPSELSQRPDTSFCQTEIKRIFRESFRLTASRVASDKP
ncbi:hypothetical protein TNCV_2920361 [Trichonephila clavipes]|nr:hypothetical protein TNCV_2920361 [Trichonephila clavipes]